MTVALTWLGFGDLIAFPVLAIHRPGASWRWFALGILSWALAVIVKTLLQTVADAALDSFPWSAQAAVSGLLSAATELGAAAFFLRKAKPRLPNIFAFGAGIGAFEACFVLALGWLEGLDGPAVPLAGRFTFVGGFFLLERLLALVGHIASRVLLSLGLARRWQLAALLAVTLFSCVDGVTMYGLLAKWDWEDTSLLVRFYIFVATIVCLEVAAAWSFGARTAEWWQTAEQGAAPDPAGR